MKINNNLPVAVIGSGSWATALVKLLTENNVRVNWWVRKEDSRRYIKKYLFNPSYLQSVKLNLRKISLFAEVKEAIRDAEFVIIATPSSFVEASLAEVSPTMFKEKIVFSAVKGFISQTNKIPAKFINQNLNLDYENIGIICGPCHAEEVAMERLSYLTIGCSNETNAKKMAKMLDCRYMKTSTTSDVIGVEFAAILKNVYALAAGISAGLGNGDNFQAILIANSIQEIERYVNVASPVKRNINQSAYLGDLLVTAYSNFSRNRTFGYMIGKGYSVKSAQIEMKMVAEGYNALKSINIINKTLKVSMPIMETTYQVIYNEKNPKVEFEMLSKYLS